MDLAHVTAPIVGGIALEVVHWFELRERLDSAKYQRLLRSSLYWAVTLTMVAVGAAVASYWAVSKSQLPSPFELLVAGAAAPSLLKNALSSFLAREKTVLGDDKAGDGPALRDIFAPGR